MTMTSDKEALEPCAPFSREDRQRRWIALTEDGPIFGLVPAEEAELARLNKEFGYRRDRADDDL